MEGKPISSLSLIFLSLPSLDSSLVNQESKEEKEEDVQESLTKVSSWRILVVGRSHTDSRIKLWIHTARQRPSNIPFAWFLVLGCNRQAQISFSSQQTKQGKGMGREREQEWRYIVARRTPPKDKGKEREWEKGERRLVNHESFARLSFSFSFPFPSVYISFSLFFFISLFLVVLFAEGRAAAAFHHSLSPFSLPLFSFPRSSSHPLATKDVWRMDSWALSFS